MTWAGLAPSGRVWTLNPDGGFGQVDWEELRGDASGIIDNIIVIALQGNPIAPSTPSSGNVLTWNGNSWVPASPAAQSGLTHNLLSTTHPDTIPASPIDGDLITASGSVWARFPIGQPGQSLSVNASGDLEWRDPNVIEPLIITVGSDVSLSNSNQRVIVAKPSGSPTTIRLPTSPPLGQEVMIKDGAGDADVNRITILPASGLTIDSYTGVRISQQYQSYTFLWNGMEWNII